MDPWALALNVLRTLVAPLVKFLSIFGFGATWMRGREDRKAAKIKDNQLDDAANRPRDRADLVDRLRSGGL